MKLVFLLRSLLILSGSLVVAWPLCAFSEQDSSPSASRSCATMEAEAHGLQQSCWYTAISCVEVVCSYMNRGCATDADALSPELVEIVNESCPFVYSGGFEQQSSSAQSSSAQSSSNSSNSDSEINSIITGPSSCEEGDIECNICQDMAAAGNKLCSTDYRKITYDMRDLWTEYSGAGCAGCYGDIDGINSYDPCITNQPRVELLDCSNDERDSGENEIAPPSPRAPNLPVDDRYDDEDETDPGSDYYDGYQSYDY